MSTANTTTTATIAHTAATRYSLNLVRLESGLGLFYPASCGEAMLLCPMLRKAGALAKRTLRDRTFQSLWRLQRPATLGVRGVVVDVDGRVLLVRHTYTPGWHFPGGGVERGETCALSLRRELKEEAGIETETNSLHLVSVHANHAFFPNDHVLVFRVAMWSQGVIPERGEIAERRFVDPLNPPAETTAGTRHRLDELFAGAATSEFW